MERSGGHCYRVEEKTMFPGFPKKEVGAGGQEIIVHDPKVYTVYEAKTEQHINPNGHRKRHAFMMMYDYFDSFLNAVAVARKKHGEAGCNSSRCGWTNYEEEKPVKKEDQLEWIKRSFGMIP